jgi:hypothetical protein
MNERNIRGPRTVEYKWLCNGEGKLSQTKARAYRKRFRLFKEIHQEWRAVPAVRSTLPLAVRILHQAI